MWPNWDCNNATGGGPHPKSTGQTGASPACIVQSPIEFQGKAQGRLPHIEAETYAGP
jgi:hypothetical protein